jgi:tRNA threonylcarbamoyladenosine biosynthesis protein TsaB
VIVLGLDTATRSTAVALRLDDGRTTQARDDPAPGEHPGHATRLLAMAHELLTAQGIEWNSLDRIAVGVGPGTFTGLRIGVATARALAQSLPAELVGVSSLQALALPALAALAAAPGHAIAGGDRTRVGTDLITLRPGTDGDDEVLAVIDARRGEVFAAAYAAQPGDEAPCELIEPRALAPEDLESFLAGGADGGARPERRLLAVGDGAVLSRGDLEALGVTVPPDSSPLHLVSAEAICELAAIADPAASVDGLLPDYRRRPDAEIALETAVAAGVTDG